MKTFTTMATVAVVMTITGCATAPQNSAAVSGVGMSSAEAAAGQISSTASVAGQLPTAGTVGAGMMGNVAGSAPVAAQAPSLVNILVQQLGVSPQQATGGAGSIFSMAKQSMSANAFGQVSNAVPGMSQLLAAAPLLGGSNAGAGGLMGGAASAIGGGSLGNMAALASSFQSLGMGSGVMNQFIPVILQYVQSSGGPSTMGLLQSAIMP